MTDQKRRNPELVPSDTRSLYEELIEDGNQVIDRDAAVADARITSLVRAGLAMIAPRQPAQVAPVQPTAAFERVLIRWLDVVSQLQRDMAEVCEKAVAFHHHLVRRLNAEAAVCHLIREKFQVMALHDSLSRAAYLEGRELCTGPFGEPTSGADRLPRTPAEDPSYVVPDPAFLQRGGVLRAIYDADVIEQFPGTIEASQAAGEETRVRQQKLPMKLRINDDNAALVALGPYGYPALFIKSRALVSVFSYFFDLLWDATPPWTPDAPAAPKAAARPNKKLLDMMAAGLKDEAIARQCGVSVRTVRRQIASIMDELGTRNRFAAGVAAVRLGWIR